MNYSKVALALGLPEDADEEKILKACNDLKQFKASVEEDEENKKKDKVVDVAASLPDPRLVASISENVRLRLNNLVEKCLVTPATKQQIETKFLENSEANVLFSSGGIDVLSTMLDILQSNAPIRLSEKTGPQVSELADPRKSSDAGVQALMRAAEGK